MAPAAAIAGVHLHGDADAGEQRPFGIERIELETHRQTLDDLDPIPGCVLRRQHREIGPGAWAHADHMRPEGAIWISIYVDHRLLTRAHVGKAGFAEIRLDPDAPARQQREYRGAGIDEIANLQVVDPRHNAVIGRRHHAVREIEPRAVEFGLGGADRWMAIDLDVRIAIQGDDGIGDLLFDRCDMVASDFEIRLRPIINGARRPIRGDKRFLAAIFALIEPHGIFGRFEVGELLMVGRLEPADLQAGAGLPRLRLIDGDLIGRRIDPEQELAFLDALIVYDGNFDDLAGNAGIDRFFRRADESVVRRDVRLLGQIVQR